MKTLKLLKMGCDFWSDENLKKVSDLENYRLRLNFIDKNGIEVSGDVSRGYKNRFTKKNGEPLKKYVKVHQHMLCADFQYIASDGFTYGYKTNSIYKFIDDNDLNYNSIDLLKLINHLSSENYTSIEILGS